MYLECRLHYGVSGKDYMTRRVLVSLTGQTISLTVGIYTRVHNLLISLGQTRRAKVTRMMKNRKA